MEPISFSLTSPIADESVTFSLTCTSNGGPINTIQWERDGVAVPDSNIYPDLTDGEMATYTTTLLVTGRETGAYACTATDGDSLSLSRNLTVKGTGIYLWYVNFTLVISYTCTSAANPPTAVSATLNTASGRVLISWDAPTTGGAVATGYRIYYNATDRLNDVSVDSSLLQFELDPSVHTLPISDMMMISIRAESAQLPSELVTVNVTVLSTTHPLTTTDAMIMTRTTRVATSTVPPTNQPTQSCK